MMWIRSCENCGRRVRTTGRAAHRVCSCPYCKAELPAGIEPRHAIAPIVVEWAVWSLGLLTEVIGILLPVAILLGHERFSMSWLGASLVAAILGFLLIASGRVSRIGSPNESVGRNVVALVLLYVLLLYGAVAFTPLDALGSSSMVVLAVFCIIMVEGFEIDYALREKAQKARFWSWLLLLGFAAAYTYHAFQPLVKR
jgi:hypothetical protein